MDKTIASRQMARPCTTMAINRSGTILAGGADALGDRSVILTSASAEPLGQLIEPSPGDEAWATAFDPSSDFAAVYIHNINDRTRRVLKIFDLRSGSARTFPVPTLPRHGAAEQPVVALAFAFDGTLYSAGDGGIRRWNLSSGTSQVFFGKGDAGIAMSGDGRFMVAAVGRGEYNITGELVFFDLQKETHRVITTHGTDFAAIALDSTGKIVATIDTSGVVRVGKTSGENPHLLIGHSGGRTAKAVTISPDRRWIASSSSDGIRVWPMPDLSKPPLHTLSHDALMAKLGELTNLRAVPDKASATGYKLEIGPFPGWQNVPTW